MAWDLISLKGKASSGRRWLLFRPAAVGLYHDLSVRCGESGYAGRSEVYLPGFPCDTDGLPVFLYNFQNMCSIISEELKLI